jgi:hypothetical protein
VLPMLYSSMTDQHQEVRAAAASVCGKVTEHLAPDDLPKLFMNLAPRVAEEPARATVAEGASCELSSCDPHSRAAWSEKRIEESNFESSFR